MKSNPETVAPYSRTPEYDQDSVPDMWLGSHAIKFGGEAQFARKGWDLYGVTDPLTGGCWNFLYGTSYYQTVVLVGNGFDQKSQPQPGTSPRIQ